MPLDPQKRFPVMCITQDNLEIGHIEQVEKLCAAGARWIQLRMKNAAPADWERTAHEMVAICRRYGAVSIINDNVDLAIAVGADGVHLGKDDLDWSEARRRLGPTRLVGGTVNNAADAARAAATRGLDYVGVGPLRFTTTKQKLAPVLGVTGVRDLIAQLGGLPAWVIGGVEAGDMAALRETGAAGAAVSGALYRHGAIKENFRGLQAAWENARPSSAALHRQTAIASS